MMIRKENDEELKITNDEKFLLFLDNSPHKKAKKQLSALSNEDKQLLEGAKQKKQSLKDNNDAIELLEISKKNIALEHLTIDNRSSKDLTSIEEAKLYQKCVANLTTFEDAPTILRDLIDRRHLVSNALGFTRDDVFDPAVYVDQVEDGDIIILASDGLIDNLPDEMILDCAVDKHEPKELAESLVMAAKDTSDDYQNERSKSDDITVIVFHVHLKNFMFRLRASTRTS